MRREGKDKTHKNRFENTVLQTMMAVLSSSSCKRAYMTS